MARQARGEYLDPEKTQIVHCINRCVRRAFLCGTDPHSNQCYEHRRTWIRNRFEFLASVFAIDCLTYTVLSNHFHLILRNRPDIARQWSDAEVARRWLTLCPIRKDDSGSAKEPNDNEILAITGDRQKVKELRKRLSDISWWMRFTAEKIARQANREDRCTGRFWQGRFSAVPILDEASLLACAIYVDLNPIRAAMAETPEQSEFTGAKDRIDDLKSSDIKVKKQHKSHKQISPSRARRWERSRGRRKSGWLSPLQIDEQNDPVGTDVSGCGRRASLKGFLAMPLTRYLQLLDWTGRQIRNNKRGAIPAELAPILERLGIEPKSWCRLVSKFGRLFKRAAGNANSISKEAHRRKQHWMQAPGVSCFL